MKKTIDMNPQTVGLKKANLKEQAIYLKKGFFKNKGKLASIINNVRANKEI